MYEKFYHLKDRPFTIVPNPGCLYMSTKHKLAFAHLQYGLMEGTGFVVLTGGIGTGKTTLIRFLLGKIHKAMDVAVVFNTNVSGSELLRLIIRDFEAGEPGPDKAANLAMLNDFLLDRFNQGRPAIVIIDEAQNLSREALEEVRLLSNLQGSKRPLLQVVLVGQPELRNKLADPGLVQLAQRITSTFHLGPLTLDEAHNYIRFRLTQAGGSTELFDDEAIAAIHEAAGGVPRVINILCNSALVHGYADELPVITAAVVQSVVAEMLPVFPDEAPAVQESPTDQELPLEIAVRVRSLEERLRAVEEKLSNRDTELHILQFEIAALKDRLARQAAPAPEPFRPAPIPAQLQPESTTPPAVQTPPAETASNTALQAKPVGAFGRLLKFVTG